jgi:putative PEP-CTERM system TPR-repeat lipoprotein
MFKKLFIASTLCVLASCGDSSGQNAQTDQAEAFLEAGQFAEANIALKNALQEDPESAEGHWLLARLNLMLGQSENAQKALTRARTLGLSERKAIPTQARIVVLTGRGEELLELPVNDLDPEGKATVLTFQGLVKMSTDGPQEATELVDQALLADPESIDALVTRARLYALNKQADKALELVRKVQTLDPSHTAGWSLEGDIHVTQAKLEDAITAYRQAVETAPRQIPERLKLALVLVESGEFADARKEIDAAIEINPEHPGANFGLGVVLLRDQKMEAAAKAFDKAAPAAHIYPLLPLYAATAYYSIGDLDQAEQYANQFYSTSPYHNGGRHLLATIKVRRADYPTAESLIRPVVEANPENLPAMNLLAQTLLAQGKTEEAIDLLEKAAALDPESSDAQLRLGAGLLASGDSGAGVEVLESVLDSDPDSEPASILMALNHLQQGDNEAAIKAAQEYRDRNPDKAAPYELLGRIYLSLDQADNAKAAFSDGVKAVPGDPANSHQLARMAIIEKDYPRARQLLNDVLAQNPDSLQTLINLAAIDSVEGKTDDMVAHLTRASQAHPREAAPRLMLARHLINTGNPAAALAQFEPLSESARQSPEVMLETARAQLGLQQYGDALATVDALLTIRPEDPALYTMRAAANAGFEATESVMEDLDRAIELAPDYMPAHLARAHLMRLLPDAIGLKKELDAIAKLDPDNVELLYLRSALAQLRGDKKESIRWLEKYLAAIPSTSTMLNLASQKGEMGDKAGQKKVHQDWLKQYPDDAVARSSLATLYAVEGDNSKAIAEYEQVIKRMPANFFVLNNLAWLLKDSDSQRALAYSNEAVKLQPESPDAFDTLALVNLAVGDYPAASSAITRAQDLAPDNRQMKYHSAMIASAAGDKSGARETLLAILDQGGTFPEKEEAQTLLRSL